MNHNKFILSSISDILVDAASATLGAGDGIESYPLCDYVMQSIFLKMTGAQEQKMKCICWVMASHDYEYRYLRYSKNPFGECSSYKDKKEIYKDLVKQIEKQESQSFSLSAIDKRDILENAHSQVKISFLDSNLLVWAQKYFHEYEEIWKNVYSDDFAAGADSLLKSKLTKMYEDHLYRHRNRIAHNTLSYQQNLPTLNTLINDNYIYDNYFIYFSILILIDNIFIKLFERYLLSQEGL